LLLRFLLCAVLALKSAARLSSAIFALSERGCELKFSPRSVFLLFFGLHGVLCGDVSSVPPWSAGVAMEAPAPQLPCGKREVSAENAGRRAMGVCATSRPNEPVRDSCREDCDSWAQNGRKTTVKWAQIERLKVSKGSRINGNFTESWSGRRESNPYPRLGKPLFYH
jgi:hypothetical protein